MLHVGDLIIGRMIKKTIFTVTLSALKLPPNTVQGDLELQELLVLEMTRSRSRMTHSGDN